MHNENARFSMGNQKNQSMKIYFMGTEKIVIILSQRKDSSTKKSSNEIHIGCEIM